MSDRPDDPDPDDLDTLAGEYVLGVVDGAERLEVRRRALAEPALAAAIARWEARLAPLAALVGETSPPSALWDRIAEATAQLPDSIVAEPGDASRPAPPAANDDRPGAWRSLALWRGLTAGALALAAAMAAIAFLPRGPGVEPGATTRVAALGALGSAPPAFVAEIQPDGAVVLIALAPAAVPEGRDLELWSLPAGAKKPVSLGIVRAGGRTVMRGTVETAPSQLLVSFEPRGGSPSGQPTGQVVYAGALIGS